MLHGGWSGTGTGFGWIWTFWILLAAAIGFVLAAAARAAHRSPAERKSARGILKRRYARVVCVETDLDRIIVVVTNTARTDLKGGGITRVTPVERILRIRTGEEAAGVLARDDATP